MSDFATVNDIIALKRALTAEEQERAEQLIPLVCDSLRYEAEKVGKDLDAMVADSTHLASVAKSVTVDVVMRELMSPTEGTPMTQMSESALGYSVSGTYLVPGGGLFIKKTELKRLGLMRQKYGVLEFYGSKSNDNTD